MTVVGDDGALTEVRRECPGWRCWQGRASATYYAIRASHPARDGYQVRAQTAGGLREQIRAADGTPADLPVVPFGALRVLAGGG